MTDIKNIPEHEAMDTILRYLIDNKSENPIHSHTIWKQVFPELEEDVVYFLLKKILSTDDEIVVSHIRSSEMYNFEVFFESNAITKRFLEVQGGFSRKYLLEQSYIIEQARLDKLQTEKLEAEVDIINFQKGLGKKLTIWGFVIAALSVLASVGTTLFQNRHDDIFLPRIDTLNHRVDSLTDNLQKTKQQLQNLKLQLSKDTLKSN
jgi:hypothetical protein